MSNFDVEKYGPSENRTFLRRRLGLHPTSKLLIHVARHHPVKDQAMLIRGFALADVPESRLVMVGEGPLRRELEALALSLGIAKRVDFVGIQKNVSDWLAAADAFALTSLSEAASLTLLEAMATGLPVIVTAVGGNPEIVRDGIDGILVPRGDAEACGRAIERLFSDFDWAQKLGANGRKRTRERYRLDTTIQSYYRLYKTLSGR